jgi:hypothetical protein
MGRGSNWYHGAGGARFIPTSKGRMASMTNEFGINMRTVVLKNVMRGFDIQMMKLYGRTREGLNMAVDYLENNMNTKPPMTPEDTGNLRRSWYKDIQDTPEGPVIKFGYEMDQKPPEGAPYAYFVHEMTEPPYENVHWTLPGSGPEWFRKHLQIDKEAMLYLISINAKKALI